MDGAENGRKAEIAWSRTLFWKCGESIRISRCKGTAECGFYFEKGEIHALMGENGAGKVYTLIKVLTGGRNLRPVQSEWMVCPAQSSTGRPRKRRKMESARCTRR